MKILSNGKEGKMMDPSLKITLKMIVVVVVVFGLRPSYVTSFRN